MWPSNVRYWSGWSSVWTARGLRPGSQGRPRGSAQDSSTPSCSNRRSQWRRVASCCWMTKRRCGPSLCAGASSPWPGGAGVVSKSRLRSSSRSGRAPSGELPSAPEPSLQLGLVEAEEAVLVRPDLGDRHLVEAGVDVGAELGRVCLGVGPAGCSVGGLVLGHDLGRLLEVGGRGQVLVELAGDAAG